VSRRQLRRCEEIVASGSSSPRSAAVQGYGEHRRVKSDAQIYSHPLSLSGEARTALPSGRRTASAIMRPRNNRKPAMTDTAPDVPAAARNPLRFRPRRLRGARPRGAHRKSLRHPRHLPLSVKPWSPAATSSPAASR
jgi:hypothetical protein